MTINSESKINEWQGKVIGMHKSRKNYPAAPSASLGVLRRYEELFIKAIDGKTDFKILLLGSTPELIDLIRKYKGRVTTIDINMNMIMNMRSLLIEPEKQLENIVRSDWLNNPLRSEYFDVVIGDGVLNNVSLDNQSVFVREIVRLLKPNAAVILREGTISPEREMRDVETIDKEFREGKLHWFDLFIDLYLYSDLTEKYFIKERNEYQQLKFYKELEKAYTRGRLSRKAIEALWWMRKDMNHTLLNRFKLIEILQTCFNLEPVKQVGDYKFTQDMFIFFFGRKP